MKQEEVSKQRNSNLEILRIIAIIMIIMHHYAIYSGFLWDSEVTVNRVIIDFFKMFGKLGVCLFIIISGYFYDKSKFTIKKFTILILQVFIYAIIGLGIGIVINSDKLNIMNIIKSILPTTMGLYWFASCYVLIYIFTPFFRKIIGNISKKDFKILLTIMIFIWGILANIPKTKTFFSEFIWLIVIYFIGAYIKKYNCNFMKNNKNRIGLVILIIIMMNIMTIVLELLATKIEIFAKVENYVSNINSPFVLVLTILIFTIFKSLKVKNNRIINKIASTTFGIYLIHENVFLRDIIWEQLVNGNKYISSPFLILNAVGGVVGVFLLAMVIDFIIEKLIINSLIKIMSKIYHKIRQKNIYSKIENKIMNFYNN